MVMRHRKPNRLQDYDYSQAGVYFLTLCLGSDQERLWTPENPRLSPCGKLINRAIQALPAHYPYVTLDKYVIMPNPVHLILVIAPGNVQGLSVMLGQMKRWVSREIGHSIWQKSFHDHIIRDEEDYQIKWAYIDTNPQRWQEDCFYEGNASQSPQ